MNALPRAFVERMAALLGAEAPAFLAAYEQPPHSALRMNTLKLSAEAFSVFSPFPLRPVPWCASGFLLPAEHEAGKHPFHAAGLYYLQEPSAMAVGEILDAQPGERVLDLCAAPGGKSTHLAARLQGSGLLVANEIIPSRAHILSENLERWGARNALITVESPERLAEKWPGAFDRVLVDAPCSGEGMFRKSATAIREWSPEHVRGCALRQGRILDQAALLVRPGGVLVYSTCTFAPEEDEGAEPPIFSGVIPISISPRFRHAQDSRQGGQNGPMRRNRCARRRGFGRTSRPAKAISSPSFSAEQASRWKESIPFAVAATNRAPKRCAPTKHFAPRICEERLYKEPTLSGAKLYAIPEEAPDTDGLRVLWPGWELGSIQKGRFEPSHALAMGLASRGVQRTLDLPPDEDAAQRYLHGESLSVPGEEGWVLVTTAGYPLGWGKRVGTVVKNHYPRALRWPRRVQD